MPLAHCSRYVTIYLTFWGELRLTLRGREPFTSFHYHTKPGKDSSKTVVPNKKIIVTIHQR